MAKADRFRWGQLIGLALMPALLYATGVGAILPVLPLIARQVSEPYFSEASQILAIAGVISAQLMVGELIGNLPSGWLVRKVGERYSMIFASVLSIVGLIVSLVFPSPWTVGFGALLIGLATAIFGLARHAFITSYVPLTHRARVLATVGGIFRFGNFAGPFITVAALALFSNLQVAYWIHLTLCVTSIVVLLFSGKVPEKAPVAQETSGKNAESDRAEPERPTGIFRTIVLRRNILLRVGAGAAAISALRAGRIILVPLWAVSIGLDDATTATVVAVSGGIDFALFYIGGWIIDRYGRLWNAIPSTLGVAISLIVLAFSITFPHPVIWFITLTMVMSVANGLGTGILLTLGADFADPGDPAPFLGAWRLTGSIGNAGAPLLASGLTALISLPFAVAMTGVIGLIGAGFLLRYIPLYLPHDSYHYRKTTRTSREAESDEKKL